VVPKREDEDDEAGTEGEKERRLARAPDLTPQAHKLFLVPYPNGGPPVFEPSHFARPDMQWKTWRNHWRRFVSFRTMDGSTGALGGDKRRAGRVRAQRDEVWKMCEQTR